MEQNGIYNLSEAGIESLYVCSDLEGANVFNFEGKIPGPNMKDPEYIEEIEDKIISDEDSQKAVINDIQTNFDICNGIITNIKNPKAALAYTGDLFDNRPHSLRLLKNMVNMKMTDNLKNRIILIGGNRDFNKLRLGVELFLILPDTLTIEQKNKGDIFSGAYTLSNLLSNEYDLKFAEDKVPEYLNHSKWTFGKDKEKIYDLFESVFKDSDHSTKYANRVNAIFEQSMGIAGEETETDPVQGIAYKTELREIFEGFPGLNLNDDNTVCKLICLLFMAMCFDWGGINLLDPKDPASRIFNDYSGLIYKYLKNAHSVAYFSLSSSKNGFLTHSGMRSITSPLGYEPNENEKNLDEFLPLLQEDLSTMLNEYNNYKTDKQYLALKKFIRYVAITSPPYDKHSPIVKGQGINTNHDIKIGGTDFNEYTNDDDFPTNYIKSEAKTLNIQKADGESVTYNIFGHLPNVFFPATNIVSGTIHVALDVCKADFGTTNKNNNYSFAMLKLTTRNEEQDELFGRTRFGKLITDKFLEDHVIYYKQPVLKFKRNNDKITLNGMTIELKLGENFSREVTICNAQELVANAAEKAAAAKKAAAAATVAAEKAAGGSKRRNSKKKCKHICGPLCKKCHKHDHHCMLKCRLCDKENCRKKHKTRKLTKKTNVTRHVKKYRRHRPRKNTRKRHTKKRRAGKSS